MLSGDLEYGFEPELVELHRTGGGSLVVGLVHGQDNGQAGFPQLPRDGLVPGREPFAAIHEEYEKVGALHRQLALLHDELVQGILAGAEQAAGVIELKPIAQPFNRPGQRIASRPGKRRDDGPARTGHAIKKGGLPHIGAPDQNNDGAFSRHQRNRRGLGSGLMCI